MTQFHLAQKLRENWVVTASPTGGGSVFLDLSTGLSQSEHPAMRLVRAKRKRERARAEAILAQRLDNIRQYKYALASQRRFPAAARVVLFVYSRPGVC